MRETETKVLPVLEMSCAVCAGNVESTVQALSGVEKIGWIPGCELQEESTPYNEQKDIAFYIDRPTAYTKIYPGQFAIYFPEDGHAPGIGQGNIRKVIVKVQVEE